MRLSGDIIHRTKRLRQSRYWVLLVAAIYGLPITVAAQPAGIESFSKPVHDAAPQQGGPGRNYADGFLPPPLSQPTISQAGYETQIPATASAERAAVRESNSVVSHSSLEQKTLTRPEGLSYQAGAEPRKKMNSSSSQLLLTIGALFGILLLLAGLARFFKKHTPLAGGHLPREALQVLGRKMLDQRHAIHYVRAGNRILILGVSMEGIRTLGEITDPIEVDQICGLCQTSEQDSPMVRSFKMLLSREERGQPQVQIDQQHRRRQQQQRQKTQRKQHTTGTATSSLNWETPDGSDEVRFSSDDIADLQRTLQEAREQNR